MKEYIEREAALGIVNGWRNQLIPTYGKNDEYVKCLETVAEHLESLIAADVRPVVRGRWEWDVLDGTPGYRPVVLCCSNCHRVSFSGWDYCPNCGADMREES